MSAKNADETNCLMLRFSKMKDLPVLLASIASCFPDKLWRHDDLRVIAPTHPTADDPLGGVGYVILRTQE